MDIMAAALEAKISRLRLDAPRKDAPVPAAPKPYTASSVEQYRDTLSVYRTSQMLS